MELAITGALETGGWVYYFVPRTHDLNLCSNVRPTLFTDGRMDELLTAVIRHKVNVFHTQQVGKLKGTKSECNKRRPTSSPSTSIHLFSSTDNNNAENTLHSCGATDMEWISISF